MSGRKPRSRSESDAAAETGESREPRDRTWCSRACCSAWWRSAPKRAGCSSATSTARRSRSSGTLNGFKVPGYLQDELRREMWTLAHAHGTLFSLACLVLEGRRPPRRADRLFAAGAVLLPLGFFLGGALHSEPDPGLGIILVPVGGLLAAAALVTVLAGRRQGA